LQLAGSLIGCANVAEASVKVAATATMRLRNDRFTGLSFGLRTFHGSLHGLWARETRGNP
jgi:hypothetical protein